MSEPSAPNTPRALPVEFPANLEPQYMNLAMIAHSPMEVVIDFARILPAMVKARVGARIILSPLGAKMLLRALAENIAKFESQFGEIRVPEGPSLAEQLFRKPTVEPAPDAQPPAEPPPPVSPQES
jgi:hypothetical protein